MPAASLMEMANTKVYFSDLLFLSMLMVSDSPGPLTCDEEITLVTHRYMCLEGHLGIQDRHPCRLRSCITLARSTFDVRDIANDLRVGVRSRN